MNMKPDIRQFLPKHYVREYPLFVEFVQEYFNYLHRSQTVTPEMAESFVSSLLSDGYSEDEALRTVDAMSVRKPEVTLRDQVPFSRRPRVYTDFVTNDGFNFASSDGEVIQFSEDNSIELDAVNADRDFKSEFNQISLDVRGIDPIRFVRSFKDLKSIAGSKKIIELFFSWIYSGRIEINYPKEKISTLDYNMVLDGDNSLRDDAFYSEFSYQVKLYGEALVNDVEAYHKLYEEHFHPAGFGLYIENENVNQVQPFDYPILIPSGNVGSYYQFSNPIEVEAGQTLLLRFLLDIGLLLNADGPVFAGVEIVEGDIVYDESLWAVTLDSSKIYSGYELPFDGNFHNLYFENVGGSTFALTDLLKPNDSLDPSGVLPINLVRVIDAEQKTVLDYRINNLSEVGIPKFGQEVEKLTQLRGLYHFDEQNVFEITEDLEEGATYMVFINASNSEGRISFGLGTSENVSDFSRIERDSERLDYLLKYFLPYAIKDTEVVSELTDPEQIGDQLELVGEVLNEVDLTERNVLFRFFVASTVDAVEALRLVVTNVTDATKVQFLVYKVTEDVLYFIRADQGVFSLSGYWYDANKEDSDYLDRSLSLLGINADELVKFINEELPVHTAV